MGKYENFLCINDKTVSDEIMCQDVNEKGIDIKFGETSQSVLNFAEDTHVTLKQPPK